jgi:hypothetical protein
VGKPHLEHSRRYSANVCWGLPEIGVNKNPSVLIRSLNQEWFSNGTWWYTAVITAHVRLRQEDWEFQSSLAYMAKPSLKKQKRRVVLRFKWNLDDFAKDDDIVCHFLQNCHYFWTKFWNTKLNSRLFLIYELIYVNIHHFIILLANHFTGNFFKSLQVRTVSESPK